MGGFSFADALTFGLAKIGEYSHLIQSGASWKARFHVKSSVTFDGESESSVSIFGDSPRARIIPGIRSARVSGGYAVTTTHCLRVQGFHERSKTKRFVERHLSRDRRRLVVAVAVDG